LSMWKRTKDEEPRPVLTQPTAPLPVNEGMPVNSVPAAYDRTARSTAMIGENVFITGQIFAKEDLIIDGQIDGTVELLENKLTIGKNGKVKAHIKAREVTVMGAVQGNVDATDKIELRRDAHLVGDIRAARIAIEDGAMFKGSIDITRTEQPKAAPRPAAAPVQPVPNMQPAQPAATQAAAAGAGFGGEIKR
jgi:cytoskeletal protein CcmA (bactofilin family)